MYQVDAPPLPMRPSGTLVLDCLAPVSAEQAADIGLLGFWALGRYVNLHEGQGGDALTAPELEAVTRSTRVFCIQVGRSIGWSDVTGRADGLAAARNLLALGLPPSTPLVCDHEGSFLSAQQELDYLGAWWMAGTDEGCSALKLYVGDGTQLSSSALFHDVGFRGYWRSPSLVPNVDVRSYQAIQLSPFDQEVLGPGRGKFDVSALQRDLRGDAWGAARAA